MTICDLNFGQILKRFLNEWRDQNSQPLKRKRKHPDGWDVESIVHWNSVPSESIFASFSLWIIQHVTYFDWLTVCPFFVWLSLNRILFLQKTSWTKNTLLMMWALKLAYAALSYMDQMHEQAVSSDYIAIDEITWWPHGQLVFNDHKFS